MFEGRLGRGGLVRVGGATFVAKTGGNVNFKVDGRLNLDN